MEHTTSIESEYDADGKPMYRAFCTCSWRTDNGPLLDWGGVNDAITAHLAAVPPPALALPERQRRVLERLKRELELENPTDHPFWLHRREAEALVQLLRSEL